MMQRKENDTTIQHFLCKRIHLKSDKQHDLCFRFEFNGINVTSKFLSAFFHQISTECQINRRYGSKIYKLKLLRIFTSPDCNESI